jgi:AraC family transcriptional regulator
MPGKILHGGEFYSPVQGRLRIAGVLLSELRQPCSRSVPSHEHELAYVTVMLNGDYLEGNHGRLDELRPFHAVFNPAGVRHSTVIGPAGAWFFAIEFQSAAIKDFDVRLPERITFDRGAGSMLWPGLALYSAFKTHSVDSLVFEGYILELLGAVAGLGRPEAPPSDRQLTQRPVPRWFQRVKERLEEGFREHLRMQDLAHEAGIHPVHLARAFRKIEKQTPGAYQQRLQVRAACQLLPTPEWPLAAIAAECGFADQSHLTRVFRKLTGTTPARFRRAVAACGPAAQADR